MLRVALLSSPTDTFLKMSVRSKQTSSLPRLLLLIQMNELLTLPFCVSLDRYSAFTTFISM
jgi:hypothetical protein